MMMLLVPALGPQAEIIFGLGLMMQGSTMRLVGRSMSDNNYCLEQPYFQLQDLLIVS